MLSILNLGVLSRMFGILLLFIIRWFLLNPQAHNLQEVMSPRAPSTTLHQQAAAALASAELQQSPVVTFRQMTQIQMPADALRSFGILRN